MQRSAMNIMVFIEPLITNGMAVAMGIGCGFVMHKMITEKRSDDNRLIICCFDDSDHERFVHGLGCFTVIMRMAMGAPI